MIGLAQPVFGQLAPQGRATHAELPRGLRLAPVVLEKRMHDPLPFPFVIERRPVVEVHRRRLATQLGRQVRELQHFALADDEGVLDDVA